MVIPDDPDDEQAEAVVKALTAFVSKVTVKANDSGVLETVSDGWDYEWDDRPSKDRYIDVLIMADWPVQNIQVDGVLQ